MNVFSQIRPVREVILCRVVVVVVESVQTRERSYVRTSGLDGTRTSSVCMAMRNERKNEERLRGSK